MNVKSFAYPVKAIWSLVDHLATSAHPQFTKFDCFRGVASQHHAAGYYPVLIILHPDTLVVVDLAFISSSSPLFPTMQASLPVNTGTKRVLCCVEIFLCVPLPPVVQVYVYLERTVDPNWFLPVNPAHDLIPPCGAPQVSITSVLILPNVRF